MEEFVAEERGNRLAQRPSEIGVPDSEAAQALVVRVALADAVGEDHERAPDHVAAGSRGERIGEVLAITVGAVHAERAHFVAVQLANEGQLAVQDAPQRADQLGEQARAARRRSFRGANSPFDGRESINDPVAGWSRAGVGMCLEGC